MAEENFKRDTLNWGEGRVSFIEWDDGVKKPGLQFAHATGFNALTYRKLLEPLAISFNIRSVDARGHGFTKLEAIPKHMFDWRIYCDDLIKSVENFVTKTGSPILLGGHSMGGASAIQVAAKRPDLVAGLILIEPVLMPSKFKLFLRFGRQYPFLKILPVIKRGMQLSDSTKKRRRNWKSAEQMFNSYKGRGAFATWPDEMIQDYISGGTEEVNNHLTLSCDPHWEAASFSCWKHDAMGMIKDINSPITLLQGEENSTTRAEGPELLKSRDSKGTFKTVEGASHFLPMEFPQLVQEEIVKIGKRIKII